MKEGTCSFPSHTTNADGRKKPVANGQPDGHPHDTGGSSCVQELSFLLFHEISSFTILSSFLKPGLSRRASQTLSFCQSSPLFLISGIKCPGLYIWSFITLKNTKTGNFKEAGGIQNGFALDNCQDKNRHNLTVYVFPYCLRERILWVQTGCLLGQNICK